MPSRGYPLPLSTISTEFAQNPKQDIADHPLVEREEFKDFRKEFDDFKQNISQRLDALTVATIAAICLISCLIICIFILLFSMFKKLNKMGEVLGLQANSQLSLRDLPSATKVVNKIDLQMPIGEGAAGTVYRGIWLKDGKNFEVAVKMFSQKKEWDHEANIYNILKAGNPNLLECLASDMVFQDGMDKYRLILPYHTEGSIFHFLEERTIDHAALFKLVDTFLDGLEYLHHGVVNNGKTTQIAHRDIKSRNVLLSQNMTCVIADFGMSVINDLSAGEMTRFPNKCRVGTTRYMAPEVLNESINTAVFESYTKADVFSASLVIWELCTRCCETGRTIADEYKQPFEGDVNENPGFSEMRIAICENGIRPKMSSKFTEDALLTSMFEVLEKCWETNPKKRISATMAKNSICQLRPVV